MRINYIVAAYFGKRRAAGKQYDKNPAFFMDWQFKQLGAMKHSLSQITMVVTGAPLPRAWPTEINGVPVVYAERENTNGSYGSWDHIIRTQPDFDYYFINEDDLIPVADNFDTILVGLMQAHGYAALYQYVTDHPAISIGMIDGPSVRKVIDKYGTMLKPRNGQTYAEFEYHQTTFHLNFLELGMKIGSMTDHGYGAKFWNNGCQILTVGNADNSLFKPTQLMT